jgi:hypothetical protein
MPAKERNSMCSPTRLSLALVVVLLMPLQVAAQTSPDDDAILKPAEPDYTIVALPSSLRLPRLKSAFRVTHRFARPINCDDDLRCPNNLFEDLFGLDNGALVGLEYRIGIAPDVQIGVHRARSNRTYDFFGQYAFTRQNEDMPLEMAARFSVEGTNNFRDEYSPTLAFIVTHLVGEAAAFHVEPIWVGNTNFASDEGDDSTFMIGLGTRLRLLPSVYLVGEFAPRLAGFKPGTHHGSIALEKRVGGHVFQLVFANGFATTLGQVAHGAENSHDWYVGFNLSRKFF